jgi:hypothetical protein
LIHRRGDATECGLSRFGQAADRGFGELSADGEGGIIGLPAGHDADQSRSAHRPPANAQTVFFANAQRRGRGEPDAEARDIVDADFPRLIIRRRTLGQPRRRRQNPPLGLALKAVTPPAIVGNQSRLIIGVKTGIHLNIIGNPVRLAKISAPRRARAEVHRSASPHSSME